MSVYETKSTVTLKNDLRDVQRLKSLVKDMKKPDNFTYLDVLLLNQHLARLEKHIQSMIGSKE